MNQTANQIKKINSLTGWDLWKLQQARWDRQNHWDLGITKDEFDAAMENLELDEWIDKHYLFF